MGRPNAKVQRARDHNAKMWQMRQKGEKGGNQDRQYPSPVFNCSLDSSQTPLLPNVLQELMDLRGRSKGITKLLEERNLMPAPATLALDTLTTAPSELATCQVIIKQGQRKGQVCSVRLPCRSHKAVSAAALATTALDVSATVSSTAMVDLPPATLMEVDAGSAPVVVAAISKRLAEDTTKRNE